METFKIIHCVQDPQMIESLLSMKAKLDEILLKSFKGDSAFENALKESFEAFINQRSNKPAELVAKFVDAELKSGSKGKTEEELEANLDSALMLFRYLSVSLKSSILFFLIWIISLVLYSSTLCILCLIYSGLNCLMKNSISYLYSLYYTSFWNSSYLIVNICIATALIFLMVLFL